MGATARGCFIGEYRLVDCCRLDIALDIFMAIFSTYMETFTPHY
jgi:hypothetical protein